MPSSNTTVTALTAVREVDRIRSAPGNPLMAISIGRVTSDSTSSGDKPFACVSTCT